MIYLSESTDKMYFHFWRDGIGNAESLSHSSIFPNGRPNNEWYKVQLIQTTHDGNSCRQDLKINGRYVWQKLLSCPSLKRDVLDIYTTGQPTDGSRSQIKNFKFFTHPLTTSWFWNKLRWKLFFEAYLILFLRANLSVASSIEYLKNKLGIRIVFLSANKQSAFHWKILKEFKWANFGSCRSDISFFG